MGDINININFYDSSEFNLSLGEESYQDEMMESTFDEIEGEVVEEAFYNSSQDDCTLYVDGEPLFDDDDIEYVYDESSEEVVYFDDLDGF